MINSPVETQVLHHQTQSPLYALLPAELRLEILRYCLAVCGHPSIRYNQDSIWRRPDHDRPFYRYSEVLRTCRRLHNEGQLILTQNLDYTIFFTSPPERPPKCTNPFLLERRLSSLAAQSHSPGIRHLQIFGHLSLLESTQCLQDLFNIEHLHPRTVTITIRHTDFHDWGNDAPLAISATWIKHCKLPSSVRHLVLEVESLERKASQVKYLTKAITTSWSFIRGDGTLLVANPRRTTQRLWQGRSTLNDRKWIRDEDASGYLNYHTASLHFYPRTCDSPTRPEAEDLTVPSSEARPVQYDVPSVRVADQQFHRMLTRHTNAIFAGSQHGGFLTMCPGSWPGEARSRSGSVDEMDPTWLFPKLDWLLMEPEDPRFGGRATGYYHQYRAQRSRCPSVSQVHT